MADASSWVARDTARVWHGFTQMSTYPDNAPIIVSHAHDHTLVDVDGNEYLDAISSLWVTTLGHRVPELDDAIRAQLDRVAHSTMLGHGNVAVIELAEALALYRKHGFEITERRTAHIWGRERTELRMDLKLG